MLMYLAVTPLTPAGRAPATTDSVINAISPCSRGLPLHQALLLNVLDVRSRAAILVDRQAQPAGPILQELRGSLTPDLPVGFPALRMVFLPVVRSLSKP